MIIDVSRTIKFDRGGSVAVGLSRNDVTVHGQGCSLNLSARDAIEFAAVLNDTGQIALRKAAEESKR